MNKCNLVSDLLPLYAEDLLSGDSKQFVERHLAKCAVCSKKLKILNEPALSLPSPECLPGEEAACRSLKSIKLRFRRRSARLSAISVCLSALMIFCAVFFPLYSQKQSVEHAATAAAEERFARELQKYLFGSLDDGLFDRAVLHPAFEVTKEDTDGAEKAALQTYTADGSATLVLPGFAEFVKPRTSSIWFYQRENFEGCVWAEDTSRALSYWLEHSAQDPPWYLDDEMGARSMAAFAALRDTWETPDFPDAVRRFLADGKVLRADDPSAEVQDKIHIARSFAEEFLSLLSLPDPAVHCYSFTGSVEGFAFCAPLSREWFLFLQQGELTWKISFCFSEEVPFPSDGEGLPRFLSAIDFRSDTNPTA